METTVDPQPERLASTRRVAWAVALCAVVSWALLIGGAVVMEAFARDRLTDFVAERAQSILGLERSHPVSVDLGGAPLVLQAWGQRLDRVEVTAEDVSLGSLVGSVHFTALGVPFDASQEFGRVQAELRVAEDAVSSVVSSMTDATVSSVELAEPLVKLGTTVTIPSIVIFGVTISPEIDLAVGVGLEPFVSEGRIAFTPVSFAVNDTELSAEAFADLYREAAQALTRVGALCVADQLPSVLQLETVVVSGDELVIGLGADNAVFSAESLAARGTCD